MGNHKKQRIKSLYDNNVKKQGKLFEECEEIFYKNIKEKQLSEKLAHYVWDVLLRVQRGYSFNRSHCLAYSLIALQEMNLCFRFPIVYWNTACLITDSGAEDAGTDYNKIATAIGKMRNAGIKIELPDINSSNYGFEPKESENAIYCGFKSLVNVGNELVNTIIENRPYANPKDFLIRIKPNRQSMISLIKGGAFDKMLDRKICMAWYLWETCDKKKRLTLQNLNGLMSYGLLPEDTQERITARRIFEFNRYLKAISKDNNKLKPYYFLDERAINFLQELGYDKCICSFENNSFAILKDDWNDIYQEWMNIFRQWINGDKENLLGQLNDKIFKEEWDKYAKGTISSWEMESLCFYYHEHELANVNIAKYGILPFSILPTKPVVERSFEKGGRTINIFQLNKICGTCIAKDKNKSTISLLTTDGVVEIKLRKEHFSLFDKQISKRNPDGTKSVVEKSWFNRGSMLVIQGIRSEDNFLPKKYSSSSGHQLYKIDAIDKDGDLVLRSERAQGEAEDEEV